jgi:hypothetical protein
MELNTPPFNEKEFLLSLLTVVSGKFGSEQRHIFTHKFNSIEPIDYPNIKSFRANEHLSKKFISQWFAEAERRKFVTPSQNHFYNLTESGYEKANQYKHPIKYFYSNNYKWAVPIVISVFVAITAILRYIQCK